MRNVLCKTGTIFVGLIISIPIIFIYIDMVAKLWQYIDGSYPITSRLGNIGWIMLLVGSLILLEGLIATFVYIIGWLD